MFENRSEVALLPSGPPLYLAGLVFQPAFLNQEHLAPKGTLVSAWGCLVVTLGGGGVMQLSSQAHLLKDLPHLLVESTGDPVDGTVSLLLRSHWPCLFPSPCAAHPSLMTMCPWVGTGCWTSARQKGVAFQSLQEGCLGTSQKDQLASLVFFAALLQLQRVHW